MRVGWAEVEPQALSKCPIYQRKPPSEWKSNVAQCHGEVWNRVHVDQA